MAAIERAALQARRICLLVASLAASIPGAAAAAPYCNGWSPPATGGGPYSPFSASATNFTLTIRNLSCPKPVVGEIGITTGGSGTYTPRRMTSTSNPSDFLQYNLVDPASPSSVITDLSGSRLPFGDVNSVSFMGTIPAGQNVAPGTYTDTVSLNLYSSKNPPPVFTFSAQLTLTVTVAAQCTINSGALAFGSYDPLAASPLDVQGQFDIACTRTTQYWVALGPGSNALGATRRMSNGTNYLQYEIYRDSGRTTVWDASMAMSPPAPSTSPVTLAAYGRVPAAQIVPAGSYSDSVLSTVNF